MTTEAAERVKSRSGSRVYYRAMMDTLPPTDSGSVLYSRRQARAVFAACPQIDCVEYVTTGNKTDSQFVGGRGVKLPPQGVRVIVCSTGGRWGKSRREY